MALTLQEKYQLRDLLIRVAHESEGESLEEPQGRPAGYIPRICLEAYHESVRAPFVEGIIYRPRADGGGFEYLYQDRHDQWWDGFCAFGGMVRVNFPAGPVATAQKMIDGEFRGLGLRVKTLQ